MDPQVTVSDAGKGPVPVEPDLVKPILFKEAVCHPRELAQAPGERHDVAVLDDAREGGVPGPVVRPEPRSLAAGVRTGPEYDDFVAQRHLGHVCRGLVLALAMILEAGDHIIGRAIDTEVGVTGRPVQDALAHL